MPGTLDLGKKITVIELWRIIAQDNDIGSKTVRISLICPDQTTDSESVVVLVEI